MQGRKLFDKHKLLVILQQLTKIYLDKPLRNEALCLCNSFIFTSYLRFLIFNFSKNQQLRNTQRLAMLHSLISACSASW